MGHYQLALELAPRAEQRRKSYKFVDHVGDGASVLSVEGGVDFVEQVERGWIAFLEKKTRSRLEARG